MVKWQSNNKSVQRIQLIWNPIKKFNFLSKLELNGTALQPFSFTMSVLEKNIFSHS
jgi:hypothetical protein